MFINKNKNIQKEKKTIFNKEDFYFFFPFGKNHTENFGDPSISFTTIDMTTYDVNKGAYFSTSSFLYRLGNLTLFPTTHGGWVNYETGNQYCLGNPTHFNSYSFGLQWYGMNNSTRFNQVYAYDSVPNIPTLRTLNLYLYRETPFLVCYNSKGELYINGIYQFTNASVLNMSVTRITIGCSNLYGISRGFKGYLSNIFMTKNKILTVDEMKYMYDLGPKPLTEL